MKRNETQRGGFTIRCFPRARDWPQIHFVDLLMEISRVTVANNEELQRKARFPALPRRKCAHSLNTIPHC
jgi:hypothetical protein